MTGKLAASKIGVHEVLSLACPAFEHSRVLGRFLVLARLGGLLIKRLLFRITQPTRGGIDGRTAFLRRDEIKLRIKPIADIAQNQSGTLLAGVFNQNAGAPRAGFSAHFITPYARPTNWVKHFNFGDAPGNGRLPEYRREYPARCRWRNHIVAHALDLHFRSRETGELA